MNQQTQLIPPSQQRDRYSGKARRRTRNANPEDLRQILPMLVRGKSYFLVTGKWAKMTFPRTGTSMHCSLKLTLSLKKQRQTSGMGTDWRANVPDGDSQTREGPSGFQLRF